MPVNYYHTIILSDDGEVLVCGKNDKGQLGLGDLVQRTTLTKLTQPIVFCSVAAGCYDHSVAVGVDGSLWGWGDNSKGQLGLGKAVAKVVTPTLVQDVRGIVKVVAGGDFSLALDKNGFVWCYGTNQLGQLGLGHLKSRFMPKRNPNLSQIRDISAGYRHGLAVGEDGRVWSFGNNPQGELGLGDKIKRITPCHIVQLDKIRTVSAGYYHNLALDSQDHVWGFGYNNHGQLGLGDTEDRVIPSRIKFLNNIVNVWCGGYSSFVKDSNGAVRVFGGNEFGGLGLEDTKSRPRPTENPRCKDMNIFAGGNHTFAIDREGNIFSCGYNSHGQLGIGTTTNYYALTPLNHKNPPDSTSQVPQSPRVGNDYVPIHSHAASKNDFSVLGNIKDQILTGRSVMYLETDGLEQWSESIPYINPSVCQKLFLEGSLSMVGWTKSWTRIHAYRNDLQGTVLEKQQQLLRLESDIEEYQRKLIEARQSCSTVKEKLELLQTQLQTCAMLDQSFSLLSEAQQSLKRDFLAKVRAQGFEVSSLSSQEVLVFLNLAGVPELIPWFEREQINGDGLEFVGEQEFLDQKISLKVRLLYFYQFSMLQNGLFLDKNHIKACPVCRAQTPEEQAAFWRDWKLDFPAEFELTPRLILRFQKHHLNLLNIPTNQRGVLWKILQEIRAAHTSVFPKK